MWLIVVNSSAGSGKGRKLASELIALCNERQEKFRVVDTDSKTNTDEIIEAELSTEKYKAIIAIGGDGLVNLCLQHVAGTTIGLAVIPTGTGNDFARAVGAYKKSVKDIFEQLNERKMSKIDLGKISGSFGERWYVQVLSTGFDAQVNSLANNLKWPKAKIKYTISMLATLVKFKPIDYEVDIDGRQFTIEAMLLAVANGKNYGGGMQICPNASNSDGVFDIFIVKPVSRIVLLTIFPKVFLGKHIPHPKIEILTGGSIKLSANTFAHADGEFVSELPITVTNVPKSLNTWLLW